MTERIGEMDGGSLAQWLAAAFLGFAIPFYIGLAWGAAKGCPFCNGALGR